jgi:excisionase family DNA binding protein
VSAAKHDEYLTVDEIAELLKVNPQTVRNWIERRELPAVRVGARRVRVLRADFDRYLAAGSMTAGDEQPQGAAFPVEARDNCPSAGERSCRPSRWSQGRSRHRA